MRKFGFFLIAVLLAFTSCMNKEKVKKPEVFLSEPQMIDVLADCYLIEAQLNQMKSSGVTVDSLQVAYYDQLFEHYGINDSVFEENMNYYTHQPATLVRIMDSVTNRFVNAQNKSAE